jgi:hypothetical protein
MLVIDKTVISEDVLERRFVCDLSRCKGACCVEGDYGAPLEDSELDEIDLVLPEVLGYMSDKGKAVLLKQGTYVTDPDGDKCTPTVGGAECIYGDFDKKTGQFVCGFEAAFKAGKTTFYKPISCHLYPVRLTNYDHYVAVNYHHWHVCEPACTLGQSLQVPVYKFLESSLVRRFGQEWFDRLAKEAKERGY